MTDIIIEKIEEAYSRFKASVYYDNFNLSLRFQLAEFENVENFSAEMYTILKKMEI
jgi:hypothetical protein